MRCCRVPRRDTQNDKRMLTEAAAAGDRTKKKHTTRERQRERERQGDRERKRERDSEKIKIKCYSICAMCRWCPMTGTAQYAYSQMENGRMHLSEVSTIEKTNSTLPVHTEHCTHTTDDVTLLLYQNRYVIVWHFEWHRGWWWQDALHCFKWSNVSVENGIMEIAFERRRKKK